jgi:hypothetical protein
LVIFGILALPAAGMTAMTLTNFTALASLFVVSSIIGSVSTAWQNVFVPYTMDKAAPISNLSTTAQLEAHHQSQNNPVLSTELVELRSKREREGLKISVWGSNALYLGVSIFFCITIGLSYINADAQVNAGLYVTSASGAVASFVHWLVGGSYLFPITRKWKRASHSGYCPLKHVRTILEQTNSFLIISRQSMARNRKIPSGIQILDCLYNLSRQRIDIWNGHHKSIQSIGSTFTSRIYSLDSSRIRNIHDIRYRLPIPLSPTWIIIETMGNWALYPSQLDCDLVFDRNEQ